MSERWQAQGPCVEIGAEVFLPENGHTREGVMAKRICLTRCPVRGQCLEMGLSMPGALGIWGGTNEKDRRRIRRQREDAAA